MATTQTIPAVKTAPEAEKAIEPEDNSAPAAEDNSGGEATEPSQQAESTAMVPVDAEAVDTAEEKNSEEPMPFGPLVARLPVELNVMVPVRDFRVRNLLALEPGKVIESQWGHGDDVPLRAGAVTLAWNEFEVIDTQLAVRITRLS